MTRTFVGTALCIAASAWVVMPSAARAQEAQGFGRAGQVAFDSTGTSLAGTVGVDPTILTPFVAFAYSSSPVRVDENDDRRIEVTRKRTGFLFNPGVDVFVIDHLSIGGEVLFATASENDESVTLNKRNGIVTTVKTGGPSPTSFGIMPRIGYDIPLGRHFSFWPRGGFGFLTTSTKIELNPNVTTEATRSYFLFYADAVFLWHPAPHFFLGLGPGFTHSVSHSFSSGGISISQPQLFTFRFLSFTIGGTIN